MTYEPLSKEFSEPFDKNNKFLISDKWYRAIIQNTVEGFFITDLKGKFLDVNNAFCRMEGYSRSELLSMGLYDIELNVLNHPEDRIRMENYFLYVKEHGENYSEFLEVKHKRKDGVVIDVSVCLHYMNIMGGILFHFDRDVTEQKKLEEALKFSDAAFKAIREGIIICDLDFRILSWNEESERIYGIKSSEAIGEKLVDIIKIIKPSKNEVLDHYNNIIDNGYSHSEHLIKTKNKITWVDVSGHIIRDGDNKRTAILLIISDISGRKKLEVEIVEYKEHLEDLVNERTKQLKEELNKRAEFTRALAHELNTPLTPLLASAELLQSLSSDENASIYKTNIIEGANELKKRIKDLLDLARGEVGMLNMNMLETDISPVVENAIKYIMPSVHGKNMTLKYNIQKDLPFVLADSDRIHQVLLNLLDNAVKYTKCNGEINVIALQKEEYIEISISDTGFGIDKNNLNNIFKPYTDLGNGKNECRGLGLGLSLSKTIIELHDGSMIVESTVNKGSKFGFKLPICKLDKGGDK